MNHHYPLIRPGAARQSTFSRKGKEMRSSLLPLQAKPRLDEG